MMKTKHAVLIKPRRFEIQEIEITPKSDQILARVESCGLCNYELNHWKGMIGNYPQTLGHEWTGTVFEVGSEVKGFKPGDKISVIPEVNRDGFSEYTTINYRYCAKISNDVEIKYALGEPIKCVVTVIRAASPEVGDNGVVLGCGPMGLWSIQAMAGNLLSSLIAVDIDNEKLKLASRFGATHTINPIEEDVEEKIKEITKGSMADFVIEGTGVPALLNKGLAYLKTAGRGRLIVMSAYETNCKEFNFREAIKKSVQIIVAHPGFSVNQFEDFHRAISLINNGTFKVKELISHEFKLENIQEAFETLESKPAGYIKGIVIP